MATEVPKRIHLLGDGRYEEATAAVIVTPGQLVKLDAAGALILHTPAGGPAEANFVLEDALQGHTIDDAQAVGDLTPYIIGAKADVIYAFLDAGESVTPADYLTSAGNGSLRVAGASEAAIAVALETKDNSASDSVNSRIRVRII